MYAFLNFVYKQFNTRVLKNRQQSLFVSSSFPWVYKFFLSWNLQCNVRSGSSVRLCLLGNYSKVLHYVFFLIFVFDKLPTLLLTKSYRSHFFSAPTILCRRLKILNLYLSFFNVSWILQGMFLLAAIIRFLPNCGLLCITFVSSCSHWNSATRGNYFFCIYLLISCLYW